MSERFIVTRGRILKPDEPSVYLRDDFHYRRGLQVINNSSHTFYLSTPEGMVIKLNPYGEMGDSTQKNHYPVKKERRDFSSEYVLLVYTNYGINGNNVSFIDGSEDERMRDIQKSRNINSNTVDWREEIPIDKIVENENGIFYLPNSDLTITVNEKVARSANHFRSTQKIRNDFIIAATNPLEGNSANIYIRLIDNEFNIGDQWIIFHHNVVKLKAAYNPLLKTGVYISGLTKEKVMELKDCGTDYFYSIEEIRKGETPFEFFSSEKEALIRMNLPRTKELELIEKEKDREHSKIMKEKEQVYQLESLNQKKVIHDLEKKLTETEKEYKLAQSIRDEEYERRKNALEIESMHRKHNYETKHDDNKAFIETIKTAGLIFTAALTVYSFIK